MVQVKPAAVRALVMAMLAGFAAPAQQALADCPELEALQRAYFDASQNIPPYLTKEPPWRMPSPPSRERCEAYRRLAEAAKAWVEYARHHDELCRFSGLLPLMELEYSRAAEARDDICAGRPSRSGFSIFPIERGMQR
jgi:hypothetical protein